MEKAKTNTYHIETKDGTGSFNFFTTAKTNKRALMRLLTNSSDFKNIVREKNDLIITVKQLDNGK